MIDLRPACRGTLAVLAAVTEDQYAWPTPCGDDSVADVIDHLSEVSGLTTPDQKTAGLDRLAETWSEPSAWTGDLTAAGLTLPNEVWGRIALTEVVVHGWDIAQAIHHPFELPEQTLRATLDHVVDFIPTAPVPELWGPAVAVPDDAPLIDQIVARTGRNPAAFH